MGGFENCSLCAQCDQLVQTNGLLFGVSLESFFLIASAVIALHLLDIMLVTEGKLEKLKDIIFRLNSRRIIHIIFLAILIMTLPFITILILLAFIYKGVCSVVIRRNDKRFVKFLDSFDVFCCLEENTKTEIRGVIQSNTIELAVDNIREKLRNVFKNHGNDKIFYRRNEEYGFYYWRRYSFIDLSQYVQIVEVPDGNDRNAKVKESLQDILYKDEGLFKLLIVKNAQADNETNEYKIILKFHQTVKDAALIEFVTRLVENTKDCQITLAPPETKDYNSPDVILNMITKLCGMLAHCIHDDVNIEQNSTIVRLKKLEWTKSDENLLCIVKDVRDNVYDLKITSVMHQALDNILRKLESDVSHIGTDISYPGKRKKIYSRYSGSIEWSFSLR